MLRRPVGKYLLGGVLLVLLCTGMLVPKISLAQALAPPYKLLISTATWSRDESNQKLLEATGQDQQQLALAHVNGDSWCTSISDDGRFIAFVSTASNLVPNDTNGAWDLFLYDRLTNQTIRYFEGSTTAQGDCTAVISGNGNFVVLSYFNGDPGTQFQIYLYNRLNETIELISKAQDGAKGDCSSYSPSISSDANKIFFTTCAQNLGIGDAPLGWKFALYDRISDRILRVQDTYNGDPPTHNTTDPGKLSSDGTHLAIASVAQNLTPDFDSGLEVDVFVYDLLDTTGNSPKRASVALDNELANGWSLAPDISSDGRFVAFTSTATNLVTTPIDSNWLWNTYVRDMDTQTTSIVSVSPEGAAIGSGLGSGNAFGPSISGDGKYVAFFTNADEFGRPDQNAITNVFVRDTLSGTTHAAAKGYNGDPPNAAVINPHISKNGRWLTFESRATNLVQNDTSQYFKVFVHDLGTGRTYLVSKPPLSLFGQITFRSSIPASQVSVNVNGRIATTDDLGEYSFSDLSPGWYTVTPSKPGIVFEPPSRTIEVPVTQSVDFDALCPQNQWLAEYYAGSELTGRPLAIRCEPDVDYYWPQDAKVGGSLQLASNFAARWTQTVQFETAGTYRFRVFGDDRFRLFIDASQPIADWNSGPFREKSATVPLGAGWHTLSLEYENTAGEALLDIDWYLCPNGVNDCKLNITPQYQTSYLTTAMPRQCTNDREATIARWGCAITSIAMALQPFFEPRDLIVTPADLNEWLSKHGGYTKTVPECVQLISDWKLITDYAKWRSNDAVQLVWKPANTTAMSVIRDKHLPVILKTTWTCKLPFPCSHFVLATDVAQIGKQEALGINDPIHAWGCPVKQATDSTGIELKGAITMLDCPRDTETYLLRHASSTLEESTYTNGQFVGYLAPREGPATSSLQIDIENAQVQLEDSAGNVTGYLPQAASISTEIPNSFYFDPTIVLPTDLPEAEPSAKLRYTLFLPEHAEGDYVLRVFHPVKSASIELDDVILGLITHDPESNVQSVQWSTATGDKIYSEYKLTIELGKPWRIEPIDNPVEPTQSHTYLPLVTR